jgi:hypothetical protein
LIAVCSLLVCIHRNKEITGRITNSDRVAINYFNGDGKMNTVVAGSIVRDGKRIYHFFQQKGKPL